MWYNGPMIPTHMVRDQNEHTQAAKALAKDLTRKLGSLHHAQTQYIKYGTQAASDYYDQTFTDTCRLWDELCKVMPKVLP